MFFFFSLSALGAELTPFASDGCSAFPDGLLRQRTLWLNCCIAHDYAYWMGGSEQERKAADTELEACVATLGESEVALLMLMGVRVGGTPWLPTPFRWGYGWPYPKAYKALTEKERLQVKRMLESNLSNASLLVPASLQ